MNLTGIRIEERYEIQDLLTEGGTSVIYRAHDMLKGFAVAIKILEPSTVSNRMEDVVRYQGAIEKISLVSHPNIIGILGSGSLIQTLGPPLQYLIMELSSASNLHDILKAGRKFSPDEAAEIVLQTCRGLGTAHGIGIIHADIKPGNILLDMESGDISVKLIDFGLAHIKKPFESAGPGDISGTFCYMPPEQAGIIRRNIDERSDLYSLGVTLYELLSGALPFCGNSLIAVLHEQAAKIPEPPSVHNAAVPKVLDAIALKLLAKEPGERYQSVAGLIRDLERFIKGDIDFSPGRSDISARIDFNTALVGREAEMARLTSLLGDARGGKGRICLVSGEAGIGKTRLMEELRKQALSLGVPLIEGRAFNRENKNPHGPLHDALSDYLRQFRRYDEARRTRIIERVRKECGDLGRIITEFNPLAEMLLGNCPEVVPLEPEREIQRFYSFMCRFSASLARAEEGMVVMLDDLHWSDRGTLSAIEELRHVVTGAPLLVLCGFRQNDLEKNHPLMQLARHTEAVEEFPVSHFNPERITSLMRGIVRMSDDDTRALAVFVGGKSGGNPLYSIEIIKQLINEKAITFKGNDWTLDAAKLDSIVVPETVIDTLILRTGSLSKEDNDLLSRASVIGNVFDLELLMRLEPAGQGSGITDDARMRAVINSVDRAMEKQIVQKMPGESGSISFAHDRVHDAYYERVPPKERIRLHRRIGELLDARSQGEAGAIIFDLAHHWIQAGDEEKILSSAYPAALRARKNYSHEDAIEYFAVVRNILNKKKNGENFSPQWIECTRNLGETYLDIGRSDESLKLFVEVLPYTTIGNDRASLFLLITHAFVKKGDFNSAEISAEKGLSLLDEKIPLSNKSVAVSIAKEILTRSLNALFPFSPGTKEQNELRYRMIIGYYNKMYFVYYFSNILKLVRTILRAVNISERKIGISRELALSLMNYGVMLTIAKIGRKARSSALMRRGEDIFFSLNDAWGLGLYHLAKNYFSIFEYKYDEVISNFQTSIEIIEKIGDSDEIIRLHQLQLMAHYLTSNYQEAYKHYLICKKYINDDMQEISYFIFGYPSQYYIEIGDYGKAEEELIRFNYICFEKELWFNYSITCIHLAYLYAEKKELRKAYHFIGEAARLMKNNLFPPFYLSFFYPRHANILINDYAAKQKSLSPRELAKLRKEIKNVCYKGLRKTRIALTIHCIALREMARYFALAKKTRKANLYFNKSIDLCMKLGRRYEEARTRYEFGGFLKSIGKSHEAWEQLVTASMIFDEIGVPVFRKNIASHLGLGIEQGEVLKSRVSREKTLYMIERSREFSACRTLGELLDKVLALAMELSGARGGHFFLYNDATERLERTASNSLDATSWQDYSWNVVQEVFSTGQTIMAADAASDSVLSSFRSVSHLNIKSLLCVPLMFNNMTSGVCYLENSLASGVFGEEEARIVSLLLANASITVENLLLRKWIESESASGRSKTAPQDQNLKKVIDYLEEHFAEDVTSWNLADIINVHPDYLGKQFKGFTGKTIREYVNRLRIEWAMERLEKTNDKIITIAFDAGFESLRTFNRIFYRASGMTPAEYRAKFHKS